MLRSEVVKSQLGMSLVEALVAVFFLAIAFVGASESWYSSYKLDSDHQDTLLAEAYSLELLEFFRSFRPRRLSAYFGVNRFDPNANPPLAAYTLCAHINLLDRTNAFANILNADPLAQMPVSRLDGNGVLAQANRYYQIHVINMDDFTVNVGRCNTRTGVGFNLLANERFLITVGISWIGTGKESGKVKRVVFSTILPEPW